MIERVAICSGRVKVKSKGRRPQQQVATLGKLVASVAASGPGDAETALVDGEDDEEVVGREGEKAGEKGRGE